MLGNLCIYGSFIVIACYWSHILTKLRSSDTPNPDKGGTLRQFLHAASVLGVIEGINVLMFVLGVWNSEVAALYDALLFTMVSVLLTRYIVRLSQQMSEVRPALCVCSALSALCVRWCSGPCVLEVGTVLCGSFVSACSARVRLVGIMSNFAI